MSLKAAEGAKINRILTGWLKPALVAVALFLASNALALPAEWMRLVEDPDGEQKLALAISHEKVRGGFSDMVPLANAFLEEAKSASSPELAARYLRGAALCAPSEPLVHAATLKNAISLSDWNTAFRSGKHLFDALWSDPWFLIALPVRLSLAFCLAGTIAAVGFLLTLFPYYFPTFFHDYRDLFPVRFRRYLPYASLALGVSVVLAFVPGILALFLLAAFLISVYLPRKILVLFTTVLVVSVLSLSVLNYTARLTGAPGERSFLLYRVSKGDFGSDLESEVAAAFSENEAERMLVDSILARRRGDLDSALDEAKILLAKDPKNILALMYMGNILHRQKDPVGAIKVYEEAAKAAPDNWMVFYNLSMLYTLRLNLVNSQTAMQKAESLDARAMQKYEITAPVIPGEINLAEPHLPVSLIYSQLSRPVETSGWLSDAWRLFGVSKYKFTPYYLAGLILAVMGLAWGANRTRLSVRCLSCGSIKCQRCHPRGRSPLLCDACWSLKNASNMDETNLKRRRDAVQAWTWKFSRYRKAGSILFPGFSRFIAEGGGVFNVILGCVWAFSLAWFLFSLFAPLPVYFYGTASFPWGAFVVLTLCYVISIRTGERL